MNQNLEFKLSDYPVHYRGKNNWTTLSAPDAYQQSVRRILQSCIHMIAFLLQVICVAFTRTRKLNLTQA